MKRGTTMLCVAAAFASAAVLGAQTQQQPRQQTPSERQSQRTQQRAGAEAQSVTLIGCIEPGAAANAYMLHVLEQHQMPASATGQAQIDRRGTQTAGTTGMTFVGQRVRLIGNARANLRAHVGHQVEITGTLAPQQRGTGQAAAETRVNVNNVRLISKTCAATGAMSPSQTQPHMPAPAAQTQPQTGDRTRAGAQPHAAADAMTLVGCLERGAAPNTFVLNVTETPSPAARVSPQAGAQPRGTAGADLIGRRIQLIGAGNLAPHIGHKVQITGMMTSRTAQPSGAGYAQVEMHLDVDTVTMVSTTCTPVATPGTRGTTGTPEHPETRPYR